MLVFFIHGVNTQDCRYGDSLIKNINKSIKTPAIFYSSFWGNSFNDKKHQTINYIEKDLSRAYESHQEYKGYYSDIYRYKKRRNELINNFLGDFFIYQNPEYGKIIRQKICEELSEFLNRHPAQNQIHFVAHSLGSFILWDLLFSSILPDDDPALSFRQRLSLLSLKSISTMGAPLLFLKQMLNTDFSIVSQAFKKNYSRSSATLEKLRWVNIIHSSDLAAYPLKAAIENEIGSELLFFDQYVWQDANGSEKTLRSLGNTDLAMVAGAEDAHSSYFYDNLDGAITARIIGYNLLGDIKKLAERCVSPK